MAITKEFGLALNCGNKLCTGVLESVYCDAIALARRSCYADCENDQRDLDALERRRMAEVHRLRAIVKEMETY